MSGGHFNYAQFYIRDIIDDLARVVIKEEQECDPLNSYSEDTLDKFKNGLFYLGMAEAYAQRIDWLLCGDDSEECFHKRLQEELDKIERNQIQGINDGQC